VARLVRRGTISHATLPGGFGHEGGTRLVLVISRDQVLADTGLGIVLPISSVDPELAYPFVWAMPEGLLERPSWVLIRQPRSATLRALRDPVAQLDHEQLDEIVAGLRLLIEEPGR
jgi:mRNA-degrading endonuclease toxin of MazEF toxin-antitoxin module